MLWSAKKTPSIKFSQKSSIHAPFLQSHPCSPQDQLGTLTHKVSIYHLTGNYVQSGTGLHKNTGLKETDPVELTRINSPHISLHRMPTSPVFPPLATPTPCHPPVGGGHCGGSADGVSDVGHFHILV